MVNNTIQFQNYFEKKERLVKEVQVASKQGSLKVALNKKSSNLFRPRCKEKNQKTLNVRDFNQVLEVDPKGLIATVEGMTTYEKLVSETLKYDCLPTVVPELKTITVGGALAGCGIESSSFRYGLVHETIREFEVLLGNGEIVSCTPENVHQDLYYAFPNTYGTLGYALKAKVALIPAKKFIKLTHERFSDAEEFFNSMHETCLKSRQKSNVAYIDGVIFSKNEIYLTTAEWAEDAPYTSHYDYMQIYYRSIQQKKEDYLTAHDYIWRWDTDWFWCSKVFFMQNPLMRLLFGKFMLKSKMYAKIMHFFHRHPSLSGFLEKIKGKEESIIQDILIPSMQASKFFTWFDKEIGIKPIWICPIQPHSTQSRFNFCPLHPESLYLDFGFWDSVKTDKPAGFYNRKIEQFVKNLGGFKSLYSSSFYTEKEFWELYNHLDYLNLKEKYDPKNILGNLYQKSTKRG